MIESIHYQDLGNNETKLTLYDLNLEESKQLIDGYLQENFLL